MIDYTSHLMDENALLARGFELPFEDVPKRLEEPKFILAHTRRGATVLARKIME